MILKQNFLKGRQNKDLDIRLLPKGEYREAFGIEIINSEGSDLGAIEPMLSNKQLTSYNVGANAIHLGSYADEFRKRLYWLVLSDTGSFLFEWDDINKIQSVVLGDTRPEGSRVFDLHKDFFVTGIEKVITQDVEDDLLMITDDNMQPICINIERAKTYGVNGFNEEDILLIKKPPRKAPKTTPTFTNDGSNNIEEQFFLFAYRFRYLDGEYSAPSDFSNYVFTPKPFDLDYFTLDNLGMINNNNAVKIEFDTGEKQVTEIQVLVKESLSNTLKIIETFDKEKLGWGNNDTKSLIFSNNKTIIPLPQDQLLRSFDNVPRKAKALSLLENIPVFSNYLEGYNIEDEVDYTVSLENNLIEEGDDFVTSIDNPTKLVIANPANLELTEGRQIIVELVTEINGLSGYSNTFFYTLEQDHTSILDVFQSDEFQIFINVINTAFQINFNQLGNYDVPANFTLLNNPEITFANESGNPVLNVSPVTFTDSDNAGAEVDVPITFVLGTSVSIIDEINSRSCKTNRNYEAGVIYIDKYGRRSTVLTAENNTLYVPQKYSFYRNIIVANINNKAPDWADRYKLVVKSNPLSYQTIYITEFYSEDFFTWCKLEGNNKDKVSVGDFIIIKKAGDNIITQPIKIKVLDIKSQEEDFIPLNEDSGGSEIIERAGLYMKIKPIGFSMDKDDFTVEFSEAPKGRSRNVPTTYLDLFSSEAGVTPVEELEIPSGTAINIYIRSWREYDRGQSNVIFEKQFFAQRNYASLEEWFNEVILSRNSLLANDIYGPENRIPDQYDYLDGMDLVRLQPGDRLFLKIKGAFSGGSRGRQANVLASINVRVGTGVYVFETDPKKADTDIFYETEQCFEIENGNHLSDENGQDQDILTNTPAIIKSDFFNCYTQGQGVESYRVRDEFNSKHLTVDTRPSSTSVEKYREIRRFADQTYGKPYVESTNVNGLNEFNLSTANFKELDKQYGSVQKTLERENNILVIQEEKAGYVLFGKDLITSANGASTITKIPEILGQYIPYAGNNGIGKNPESVAVDGNRVYWIDARRGTPVRLSLDGVSEINYGMVSEFRKLFIENPTSLKLGAFDPYFKKYVINIEGDPVKPLNVFCGNTFDKTITEPFNFILNINHLLGETILSFLVSDGEVNIEAVYDETTYTENNVIANVSIVIPRTDINLSQILITITPISETATIQATNTCPVGTLLKVISVVLADEEDLGTTIINRYKWGSSSFFSDNHLFQNTPISRFVVENGIEGMSKFPVRGKTINMQSYKDSSSTGNYKPQELNKIGYLVSNNLYGEQQISQILSEATFPPTVQSQISLSDVINEMSFTFNRPNGNENLYLIWDYRTNVKTAWRGINLICLTDEFGNNTGFAEYQDLEKYNTVSGIATGDTKPNDSVTAGDDYIPPFTTLFCQKTTEPPQDPKNLTNFNISLIFQGVNSACSETLRKTVKVDVSDIDTNNMLKEGAQLYEPTSTNNSYTELNVSQIGYLSGNNNYISAGFSVTSLGQQGAFWYEINQNGLLGEAGPCVL